MLKLPSLRLKADLLFLLACVLVTAYALAPEVIGAGKTKDYPLWYWVGQQVLHGRDIYPSHSNEYFEFIYPPLSAILLALPSALGRLPLYIFLCVLNAVAWWVTLQLCNTMTGAPQPLPRWLAIVPSVLMAPFVFDMFDLGQPNMLLLVMMLAGFGLTQRAQPWSAGFLFALATAIKAFPVAVLPYLLWRRQWRAAASMTIFSLVLLVLLPAPVRGFEHNLSELREWYGAMVSSSSERGFGQRDAQNWSYINQSVMAVTHRLLRPVNYNQIHHDEAPAYVNVADLDYRTVSWIVAGICALIGLGFLAIMPPASRLTPQSSAEELAILFCLMTVASPLAREYYFVWFYLPITLLMHRAALDPREPVRRATWAMLGLIACFMLLSFPGMPRIFQAAGNNLVATTLICATLAWFIRHPSPRSAAQFSPGQERPRPVAAAGLGTT